MRRKYGWLPDVPDHRDLLFIPPKIALPPEIDLTTPVVPVVDQLSLGSCTANAIASAFMYQLVCQKGADVFLPSRLFIYYNERAIEGTIPYDSGAYLRDGIKVIAKLGACPETEWPYKISKFRNLPPARCYRNALKHQALRYERVPQTIDAMKACLAAGHTIVFGFSVYESFQSSEVSKSGIVPMPDKDEKLLGGHAVKMCGYSDLKQCWKVKNSWGSKWGDNGYFWMPYEYANNPDLAADFWKITLVE